MAREVKDYRYLYEGIEDDALKNRAMVSLTYYINKAALYKALWILFSVLGIVLPAIATLFAALGMCSGWIAAITAATTVASGLLALFKCADKKTSYRNSAENLKSELSSYLTNTGAYTNDAKENNRLLAANMERIIRDGYDKIAELEEQAKRN